MIDYMTDAQAEAVRLEREALWALVEQVRAAEKAGDTTALGTLADAVRQRLHDAEYSTGNKHHDRIDDIIEALDESYDRVFPVRDPRDPADLLDCRWPTARRTALVRSLVDRETWVNPPLASLVDRAVADADVHLLRRLALSRIGRIERADLGRVFGALDAVGALDAEVVTHAFAEDPYLGCVIVGQSTDGIVQGPELACRATVHDHVDAITWRMTAPDPTAHQASTADTGADGSIDDEGHGSLWRRLPKMLVPRGLRYVRRALDGSFGAKVTAHLGRATLTDAERAELVEVLRDRPEDEQWRAFRLRLPAGDAATLLPLFGLDGAGDLLRLIQAMPTDEVVRQDRSAILAAAAAAGATGTRRLLKVCPNELVSATLGHNRAAVLKRVKHHALQGIAAFGLLPLDADETALDRYLALREAAKKGAKLGPNRRLSHAAAVDVALDHLAQVSGYPDASRLEWACETQLSDETPTAWDLDGYQVTLRYHDADVGLTISKGGKELKSVPAAVRAHAEYPVVRARQELLRAQASRMRGGLAEHLVATGGSLTPDELAPLLRLPAGAAVLPALLWQDRTGTIGLLDDLDTSGPVTAVHPHLLFEQGVLAHWQAELVRRRLRQPVKQVFRELYVPTPAEDGEYSRRFDGHRVSGRVAVRLLSTRGWATHGQYADHQATRPAGDGITAALRCDFHGYFGAGDVVLGEIGFLRDGVAIRLTEVPPVAFSEAMRDLDLVVSVAGTDPDRYLSPAHADSRARVLAALIGDLGLDRVTVDGHNAVIRGSRATYRVHLNSGSIHLDPGGYLCVVPASFGATAHKRLFLPFADEDRPTSVILSKVLLLAEDEKITDQSILHQIAHIGQTRAG